MTLLERVDQYLSNQLLADEAAELERDLQRNPALRQLLDSVEMTRRMVRTQAIRAEVGEVHQAFTTDYRQSARPDSRTDDDRGARLTPLPSRPAGVTGPLGWIARLAATVLLVVVGYGGYQFAGLDRQAVYDALLVAYRLPVTRGVDAPRPVVDSLYQAGNYAAVVQQLSVVSPRRRQPHQLFLAAMSHLQLRQYKAAIAQFQALQTANRQRNRPYFEQETDYYQALAHLGAGNYERAYSSLKGIYDNPRHMFHGNVSKRDLWKINALAYKESGVD